MKKFHILILIIAISFLTVACGSDEVGICDKCSGNITSSDCDSGWCSPFDGGSYRCVPDSVGPNDPYTCKVAI